MDLLLIATIAGLPLAGAASGSLDIGTMLASYGIAAPFAALCFWQMQRSQKENSTLKQQIDDLQAKRLSDQRDFVARLAPMLYDSALLYRQGNERLSQGLSKAQEPADDLHQLAERVEDLLRRMGEQQ